jgi:hypothetical protein
VKRKRPSRDYLGETLVWRFADKSELERYRAVRTRKEWRPFTVGVLSVLTFGFLYAWVMRGFSPWVAVVTAGFLGFEVWRFVLERRLSEVRLRLHPNKLLLTEVFVRPGLFRDSNVFVLPAHQVKGLNWVTYGCHVEEAGLLVRRIVLSSELFSSPGAVEALQRWADEHGVPLEGVAPEMHGYLRPGAPKL